MRDLKRSEVVDRLATCSLLFVLQINMWAGIPEENEAPSPYLVYSGLPATSTASLLKAETSFVAASFSLSLSLSFL